MSSRLALVSSMAVVVAVFGLMSIQLIQSSDLAQLASGVCGDGSLDGSEKCDDNNTLPGDGCNARCNVEKGFDCGTGRCHPIVCGDGRTSTGEKCDDGNLENGDGCSDKCKSEKGFKCTFNEAGLAICPQPICGDSKIEGDEKCDGGSWLASGCKEDCSGPQPGRNCRSLFVKANATAGTESYYTSKCDQGKTCGNNKLDPGEQCDVVSGTVVKNTAFVKDFPKGTCDVETCKLVKQR